jgi:hypothetical protein
MMNFNVILKILNKRGGYPNKNLDTFLDVFNMRKFDFLKSMVDKFGKEGAEQFIQNSLRNRSREGRIRISPGEYVAPGYEKESFIELDLDDVTVTIEDVDNEYWHNVVLENWNVSDSNIVVETEDGEIEIYEVDGFLEEFQDLDPSDYEGALNEVEGAIERGLSNILGVKVYVEYSPFR